MRKILIILFLIFFISLATAEIAEGSIVINKPQKDLYNIGDFVDVSFTVIVPSNINMESFFLVKLLCNGVESEHYKDSSIGSLKEGEQKEFNIKIPLIEEYVGRTSGTCKIKAVLDDDYALTKEFEVSNLINIKILSKEREFNPGEDIIIEGEALKKNRETVNGIIELKVIENNSTIKDVTGTVKRGYFLVNFSLPAETKAQQYLTKIDVYEKNKGKKTNEGSTNFNILIRQVPTSLEIILDKEVEPGTSAKIKAVLYDQTGETINSNVTLKIKNNKDILLQEIEKPTGEVFEFPIPYNEPPSEFKVLANSNGLNSESEFKITEKEEIKVETINKTMIITNIGNVPYNETILVKIGNETKEMNVILGVDESKKYILSAPEGEYPIKVLSSKGNIFNGKVILSGKAVEIEEAKVVVLRKSLIWLFVIILLGISAFLFFRRIRKKKFFASIPRKKKPIIEKQKNENLSEAELSLSIKGEKQEVIFICLRIDNLKDIKNKSDVKETLQKIFDVAKENKASIYENQNFLFFILAPIKTKTFKNEKTALNLSQQIKEILTNHNRLFRVKIEFGISIDYGKMIVSQEPGSKKLKFSAMDSMTNAKKIAMASEKEILLSEKMNSRILEHAKTEKRTKDSLVFYAIKRIKDSEENKKFISNFLKRIEGKG